MTETDIKHNLGFGCVRLTYHLTYKKAISNLATAYGSGVTHFDTARLYGFGTSEKILGRFIKDKRDKVTVTSKFGLYPGHPVMGNLYIQNLSRFVFRMLKKLPTRQQAQSVANGIILHKNFTAQDAQQSLETSLRALNTDYIDYYLLHEPTIPETCNDDVISFLEKQKERGLIREYGIGSFINQIEKDINSLPAGYSVLQTDYGFPFDLPSDMEILHNKRVFFFSPFRYYTMCKELLQTDTALANELSHRLNTDVNRNLLHLFIRHQLMCPFSSTTLFTSSQNKNIRDTIETWSSVKKDMPIEAIKWQEAKTLLQSRLRSKTRQ